MELADQLSFKMGLRTNGIAKSLARRNKYLMGRIVGQSGARSVQQANCKSLNELHAFLDLLCKQGSYKCVVKPPQSAGTDNVFLCSSIAEAEKAFDTIFGKVNGIGLVNDSVLVQEFLSGTEYVVDKVSRDGVHKLMAIWKYDKRSVNESAFVYFCEKLMPSNTEVSRILSAYADKVLTALDILNGPCHMEIMLCSSIDKDTGKTFYDPCLIEVGARCHGGEGTWMKIVKECIGFTSVEIGLDVYLEAKLWNQLNSNEYTMHKSGIQIFMVSRQCGVVRSLPGDALIRALPSFRGITWEIKTGDFAHKTIDCFTRPGHVELVADNEEDIEKDYNLVHSEDFTLIEFEEPHTNS